MTRFIELSGRRPGEERFAPIAVNLAHVVYAEPYGNGARLTFCTDLRSIETAESYAKVRDLLQGRGAP